MGHVEPVYCLDADERNERTAGKRADCQSHIETDIVVRRTQIDKVACTYCNDTTDSYYPQQSTLNIEIIEKPIAEMAAAAA